MHGAMQTQCATHVPDALHERTDGLTYAEALTLRESSELSNARTGKRISEEKP